ncbi:hypothetical protein CEXT_815971 [Caerostris extrusa]|uniref:Uncharacterized protein n=1 Tax=Caerostris extrusa TaxID=172846 RepID=A0AAV4W5C2_CAEEX|nr:hypothetical protein CEXT_815971 [Caerostris extrusa]
MYHLSEDETFQVQAKTVPRDECKARWPFWTNNHNLNRSYIRPKKPGPKEGIPLEIKDNKLFTSSPVHCQQGSPLQQCSDGISDVCNGCVIIMLISGLDVGRLS